MDTEGRAGGSAEEEGARHDGGAGPHDCMGPPATEFLASQLLCILLPFPMVLHLRRHLHTNPLSAFLNVLGLCLPVRDTRDIGAQAEPTVPLGCKKEPQPSAGSALQHAV